MGRGGYNRRNRGNKDGNGNGGGRRDARPAKVDYSDIVMENEMYEKYYKESGLIPEEEWDEFWESLKRTLPTTFRFTGSKGHALTVLSTLQDTHVPHLRGIEFEGQLVDPPIAIPWYPDNLAWRFTIGKNIIRRSPPFKKFQNFLVNETTVGNISRQEEVSMIPPLLMDIKPHHVVLDMCAAPGSKTAQLIEMLHMGEEKASAEAVKREHAQAEGAQVVEGEEVSRDYGRPTGLIIANDADYRRSHMLIHQTKRLNSPNLIVTNNDATAFPGLIYKAHPKNWKKHTLLKFDRVLADVPCSGDGTPRKNYNVWREWTPIAGLNLHITQVRILVRGLQMLKVGGRIVYSTCSMNPIENEAVVAAAIHRCGGVKRVRVVDVSNELPALKRRPGLKGGWKVMDKEGRWWDSYEEACKGEESGEGWQDRDNRMVKGMWYNPPDGDEERVQTEGTLRIYPHLQDTGGFYVAVLEKIDKILLGEEDMPKGKKVLKTGRKTNLQEAGNAGESSGAQTPAEVGVAIPTLPPPAEDFASTADPTATAGPPSPSKRRLESPSPATSPSKRRRSESPLPQAEVPTIPPISTLAKEEDEDEDEDPDAVEGLIQPLPKSASKQRGPRNAPSEEPFKFLPSDHPVLTSISTFYSVNPLFPRTSFMVRNAEALPTRAIYYTSSLAKTILENNDQGKSAIRFVHCGVKMFVKQDVQDSRICPWRIQSDGMGIVEGWIGKDRIITARKRRTVKALLKELFPRWDESRVSAQKPTTTTTTAENEPQDKAAPTAEEDPVPDYDCTEITSHVRNVGMGCCVLRVEPGGTEDDEGFPERMVLPLWKSNHSINLMLPKEDRKALLSRVFNDDGEIRDSTNRNRQGNQPKTGPKANEVKKRVAPAVQEEEKKVDAAGEDTAIAENVVGEEEVGGEEGESGATMMDVD